MANPPLTRALTRHLSQHLRRTSTRGQPIRHSSTHPSPPTQHDPFTLLSKPTWSVRQLLDPPTTTSQDTTTTTTTTTPPPQQPPSQEEEEITEQQLHHLLRLSALPPPSSESETSSLLSTLRAQLRFVRAVQQVPGASSVQPLAAIRDETAAGMREAEISLHTAGVKEALEQEEIWGRCRRPRRRRRVVGETGTGTAAEEKAAGEEWDVLGMATERVGRYFVVRSGGSGSVKEGGGNGKEGGSAASAAAAES
ncbi:hypothetical protein VTJ49DRAFT_3468 [Mycothermus thermophilus]|uniref:Glutamyl-tRNA amidotransferase complex subunit Gta3 domain-containing protein n=1 Tax=Humicola insolens TaxID=85995 RepID=A0ABR3VMJ0_HUMIN